MITIRKRDDRGHFDHGWLNTYHTFSFADYHDPAFMGFRSLRVINEDRVTPAVGFGTHGHRDMEIVSYVLEGELEHHDNMGNGSIIKPGDVQRMSAGTGVMHSEKNPSPDTPVHFYQIWILPEHRGITPSYEQKTFTQVERQGRLRLVASPDGRDGSVTIHQDVALYSAIVGSSEPAVTYELQPDRYGWLQVARGEVELNGQKLAAGDGAAITAEPRLTISGDGEVLLFDLN
jgi:redox-sensitive bicupin YhaK (pirin superfamily)